jgi:hypothetical protein
MMLRLRLPATMHALRALCIWGVVTGGASALAAGVMLAAMQAGEPLTTFAASALALLAMVLIPAALARRFVSRATVPVATALALTMAAMSAAAAGVHEGAATPLTLGGIALLATAWSHLRRETTARSAHAQMHAAPLYAQPLRNNTWLIAPALLAGLSSGVLARFQFFAICGRGTASATHIVTSLVIVAFAGWLAERVDHRRALLVLFALRGALLAALTLDSLAPWAALAMPAFAMLDYLTLPTLMRGARASRASQAGCPGLAHHAGMLAGAALATTSWGFGQGFYALFLLGGVLNLACAGVLAARRNARTHYPASPAFAAASGIDLH